MSRCIFLQLLTALLGGFALPAIAQTKPNSPFKPLDADWRILQISPMTRFQYYPGDALWPQLAIGQRVTLTRRNIVSFDNRVEKKQ